MSSKTRVEKTSANTGASSTYETVALVLQGGGALGSYQAGVYQGLHEAGIRPNWVAGISIGSINAAIIAGSPEDERVGRLRGFWEEICQPAGFAGLMGGEALASMFQGIPFGFGSAPMNSALAAMQALTLGQPGFFKLRFPPPYLNHAAGEASTSFYDTSPLAATLRKYVDFELLNSGAVRSSFGVVHVRTGNFAYFDSKKDKLGPEHIMASGALPPGFPSVVIDGEHYWDGGVVSNTPLAEVLGWEAKRDTLAFQVDLWPARGALPTNLEEVAERQKDIQYSSRTRLVTDRLQKELELRRALQLLLRRLPPAERNHADLAHIRHMASTPVTNVVNLIYEAKHTERYSKDYEFGTEAMREHWEAGLSDIRLTLAKPDVLKPPSNDSGFVAHDVHRNGKRT